MHWRQMRFQLPPLPLPAQWRDQSTPCSRCHLLPNFLLLCLLHLQIYEIDSDSIYPPSPSSYTLPSCPVPPRSRPSTPLSDICSSSALPPIDPSSKNRVASLLIQTTSRPKLSTYNNLTEFWSPHYASIRIRPSVNSDGPGIYPEIPGIRRWRIGAS